MFLILDAILVVMHNFMLNGKIILFTPVSPLNLLNIYKDALILIGCWGLNQ